MSRPKNLGFPAVDAETGFEIERRLCALVRSSGALRAVLAGIAHRLVLTRAWEQLGYARLADYADERAGRSARSIQDLARVGEAFRGLPRLRAALCEGRLGWTRVRLLVRLAKPEDEARWISYARGVTSETLSREVRRVDRGPAEAHALDDDRSLSCRFEIACKPEVMAAWHYAWSLGRRVHGGRLSRSACVEMVTAEVLSALPVEPEALELEGDCSDGPAGEGGSWAAARSSSEAGDGLRAGDGLSAFDGPPACDGDPPHAEAPGEAAASSSGSEAPDEAAASSSCAEVPRELGALSSYSEVPGEVATLSSCAGREDESIAVPDWVESLSDPFELDRRLREAIAAELRLDARVGPLLDVVLRRRVHVALGFATREAYMRERLGLDPSWGHALLRVERAARTSPAFARAYREGRLTALQARALVPLLLADLPDEWAAAWAERAPRYTLRRLRDDVDRALLVREVDPAAWMRTGGLPRQGQGGTEADLEIGAPQSIVRETSILRLILDVEVARMLRAVLCTVRRRIDRVTGRLPTPGEAFGVMLHHALEAWGAGDEGIRRAHPIFTRDGWRCVVPGCTSMRNLHDHHIRFRSAGGTDDPRNRVTLCAFHHLRGVHAGIVGCTGEAPDRLRIALGVRPDGTPLAVYASGDRLLRRRASGSPA